MESYVELSKNGIRLFEADWDDTGKCINPKQYEDEIIWAHFRERCEIIGTLTLEDLINVIKKDSSFAFAVGQMYPWYETIVDEKQVQETIKLSMVYRLENDHIHSETFAYNVVNKLKRFNPKSVIEISNISEFHADTTFVGETWWSLLQIVDAIFGSPKTGSVFNPDGLTSLNDMSVPAMLMQPCEIESGTKVSDIMGFVESNEFLTPFISMYSWCKHIDKWNSDARRNPQPVDGRNLEEVQIHTTIIKEQNKFELDFEALALGSVEKEDKPILFGIKDLTVREFASLPVRITPTKVVDSKSVVVEASFVPTLLDIIDSIYFAIDFYGQAENEAMQTIGKMMLVGGEDEEET